MAEAGRLGRPGRGQDEVMHPKKQWRPRSTHLLTIITAAQPTAANSIGVRLL
jgi:hypothetical protein